MSEIQEIANAIVEINGDIFELSEELGENYSLTLKSNGGVHTVKFLGHIIHHSEDDAREWNDEKYDYDTTIEQYLRDAIVMELKDLKYLEQLGSK